MGAKWRVASPHRGWRTGPPFAAQPFYRPKRQGTMTSADLQLLATALASVLILVALIVSRLRLHPLLALLIVSVGAGLATGMPGDPLVKAVTNGAGKTLGAVGMVVALGAMLGKILADSGVTESIANYILGRASGRALPWAMALVAFVIGIPMFFEVGLVVLLPLIFSVARKLEAGGGPRGSAYAYVGVPVIAALAAMHGMVPPHPGPLTAIATLNTSVGATLVYGFVAALPAIVLAGPFYAAFIAPRLKVRPDDTLIAQFSSAQPREGVSAAMPGVGLGLLAALLPALLMLLHAASEFLFDKHSAVAHFTAFVGNPVIAMLVGVVFAACALVYARRGDAEHLRESMSASLKPICNVLLIIAGGGAFQQVLTDAHVGDAIVHLSQQFTLSPLVLGWIISMLLSVSTGSATVGIVGAAGLLVPLADSDPTINQPLLALSIGCGSLFFNYANHAGFWLVKESFGMTMGEATKTISVVQSIVAVVGLAMVLLLNLLPALA